MELITLLERAESGDSDFVEGRSSYVKFSCGKAERAVRLVVGVVTLPLNKQRGDLKELARLPSHHLRRLHYHCKQEHYPRS